MPDPGTEGRPGGVPRHGFVAWAVFLLALAAVLVLVTGCLAAMYAPVLG
jgi:hypothetical protein